MKRASFVAAYIAVVGAGAVVSARLWLQAFDSQHEFAGSSAVLPQEEQRSIPALIGPVNPGRAHHLSQPTAFAVSPTPFGSLPIPSPAGPAPFEAPATPASGGGSPPSPPGPGPGGSATAPSGPPASPTVTPTGPTPSRTTVSTSERPKAKVRQTATLRPHGRSRSHERSTRAVPATPARPPARIPAARATPAIPPSRGRSEKHEHSSAKGHGQHDPATKQVSGQPQPPAAPAPPASVPPGHGSEHENHGHGK